MSAEPQSIEHKLESLRAEVGSRFDRVHDDLKELTKALRDLIRLDGDIRRLQDAVSRIGRASEDHEGRLRSIEQAGTVASVKLGVLGGGQILFLTAASNAATALIVYALTH